MVSDPLAMLEDLGCTRVPLGRHVAGFLKQRQVCVGLYIAHTSGVTIPIPGPAEVPALLDNREVLDTFPDQIDGREHATKTAAHNHDFMLGDDRLPRETGLNKWILVERGKRPLELLKLRHPIRAQPFLALMTVTLAHFVHGNFGFRLVFVDRHSRSLTKNDGM